MGELAYTKHENIFEIEGYKLGVAIKECGTYVALIRNKKGDIVFGTQVRNRKVEKGDIEK